MGSIGRSGLVRVVSTVVIRSPTMAFSFVRLSARGQSCDVIEQSRDTRYNHNSITRDCRVHFT